MTHRPEDKNIFVIDTVSSVAYSRATGYSRPNNKYVMKKKKKKNCVSL